MEKVIINKDAKISELLEHGTVIQTQTDNTYFYIPFWFKYEDDGNLSMLGLDRLPEELKTEIRTIREYDERDNN